MIVKGTNGARVCTELAPWTEGGDWPAEDRWDRLADALLAWDPKVVLATDVLDDGDPFASLEYAITSGEELERRTLDLTHAPYKELVAQLSGGVWMRNTLVAWRELLFLCLENGYDEWAVLAWSPAKGELVMVDVITAGVYFGARAPGGGTLEPHEDGYMWAGYALTRLRTSAWLAAGLSPVTGEPAEPMGAFEAYEASGELLGKLGIIGYAELPLGKPGEEAKGR